MTILVRIVVILASIEPILEKFGHLTSAMFVSIVTILVSFEAILTMFFVRINLNVNFKVMMYHKL